MHVKCFAFAQKMIPFICKHTHSFDWYRITIRTAAKVSHQSHGLAVLRKLLSISPSVYVTFFLFFKCRILHNIIALLLSFPQLTRNGKSDDTQRMKKGFTTCWFILSFAVLVSGIVGGMESEFDILAFVILAQTGGIC